MTSCAPRTAIVHPDTDALVAATAARLALAVLDAQSVRPQVHVALTGGRVGTRIAEAFLASPLLAVIDLGGLHLWWGDERFAPSGHPDRNDAPLAGALAELAANGAHVHPVPGPEETDTPTGGVSPVEGAALAYAAALAEAGFGTEAAFDVVLLGVGPDGHVASLFPGHPGLAATGATTAVADSPKPPRHRVSLTLETINGARQVWLLGSGGEKAAAVARGLAGDEELPCALAHGTDQTLWLLDVAAVR